MYSIKETTKNTIEIKKSKFITILYRINNVEEVNTILYKVSSKYSDATHVCYAYILNNIEKCSDNGEPSGTAGLPILNVLKKKNLTNILAIVIRYFGGIKLGAGGLVRAYSNSIVEALNKAIKTELTFGYLIELEFSYDNIKLVDYILIDKNIIKKEYNNNVVYQFYLNENELNFTPELEKVAIHLSIKDKVLIEKD